MSRTVVTSIGSNNATQTVKVTVNGTNYISKTMTFATQGSPAPAANAHDGMSTAPSENGAEQYKENKNETAIGITVFR